MINTVAYVALLWLIARFAARDVRGVGDLLSANWVAQVVAWSLFEAVPPLAWMGLEVIFAFACIALITTRLAALVALFSIPAIIIHAVCFATGQALDTWVNAAAWLQMLVFIVAGWGNGLGRFVAKMAGPDHRFARD